MPRARNIAAKIHPLSIGDRADPVRLVFTADPGPGLVVGLADLGDRFRLVLNEIDLVAPDEPMPRLPVAHAVWKPRPDLPIALECWLCSGGPHHTTLSTAVDIESVVDLAEIVRTELVVIDEHSTSRAFGNELRWNQAYYRLAAPL